MRFYEAEFDASDALDLASASLTDIGAFYESNTFYNAEGYKYRFPRMFDLVCRLGKEALRTEFVDASYRVPICNEKSDAFASYTTEQKYCVWLAYDCLDLHFDEDFLYSHETFAFNQSNGWPVNSLNVVDSESLEYLSNNLFCTATPPMEAIRAFGAWVCEQVRVRGTPRRGVGPRPPA